MNKGGAALGRTVVTHESLACVVDVSELGSSTARQRFMSAFAESLYESNTEASVTKLQKDNHRARSKAELFHLFRRCWLRRRKFAVREVTY
jgi:hypothetical protein